MWIETAVVQREKSDKGGKFGNNGLICCQIRRVIPNRSVDILKADAKPLESVRDKSGSHPEIGE